MLFYSLLRWVSKLLLQSVFIKLIILTVIYNKYRIKLFKISNVVLLLLLIIELLWQSSNVYLLAIWNPSLWDSAPISAYQSPITITLFFQVELNKIRYNLWYVFCYKIICQRCKVACVWNFNQWASIPFNK